MKSEKHINLTVIAAYSWAQENSLSISRGQEPCVAWVGWQESLQKGQCCPPGILKDLPLTNHCATDSPYTDALLHAISSITTTMFTQKYHSWMYWYRTLSQHSGPDYTSQTKVRALTSWAPTVGMVNFSLSWLSPVKASGMPAGHRNSENSEALFWV